MDAIMEKTFDWGDGQSNVPALSLDYHPGFSNGIVGNRKRNPRSISPWTLSLGCSSRSYTSLALRKENEEESSYKTQLNCVSSVVMFKGVELQRPKLDLELSLSTGYSHSDVTSITQTFKPPPDISGTFQLPDEGSISSRWKQGSLIVPIDEIPGKEQKKRRITNIKRCQFHGCEKGARGATRLCISHGGGKRCKRVGCPNGAEGKTVFCKAHGGGNRCIHLGCTKSAEGRTGLCIRHGGGQRCIREGCGQAARGKQSSLCIKHGGGKRCKVENCTKSAEGTLGLCISHGGGRRCERAECTKGAQGSTKFCKAHGGGKRCQFVGGCSKGAEGGTLYCKGHGGGKRCRYEEGCPKSVHGGTLFCVKHGGGKRCAFPECSTSARGRTNFCARHGGGKRCMFGGCGKSAQGSSDFCKGHGGGRRCSWGDSACDKFARGKSGFCASHNTITATTLNEKEGTSHGHPPPFFLNQISAMAMAMDSSSAQEDPTTSLQLQFSLPEGRVHGGSLMAMLEGSRNLGGGN